MIVNTDGASRFYNNGTLAKTGARNDELRLTVLRAGEFTTGSVYSSPSPTHSEISGGGTLTLQGSAAIGQQVTDRFTLGIDLDTKAQSSVSAILGAAEGVGITNDRTMFLDDGADLFL